MASQSVKSSTPYDSAFKSVVKKCPKLALFLINALFYEKGLSEEEYTGEERIVLLDKELPGLEDGTLEMDLRIRVHGKTVQLYHLECQATQDGAILLRMVRYDIRSALEGPEYTQASIVVTIDNSGVIFLRSTRNTPEIMSVCLQVPQGQSVSYRIPALRLRDYTLEDLLERKLYLLLPFLFFNYEKKLSAVPRDSAVYEEIKTLYNTILLRLQELEAAGDLTAYEASTLYDALKVVFEALGETAHSKREVKEIMGGRILEFSADQYFEAGEAKGRTEGRAEGENRLIALLTKLIALGRMDEIERVTSDAKYRSALFRELQVE